MNHLSLRGTTTGMLCAGSLLSLLLMAFSLCTYHTLALENMPKGVCIFIYILTSLFLLVPGIFFFVSTIISYFKRVCFAENMVTFYHPLKPKKEFPITEITFWGCAAFASRSTVIYFCTANPTTLLCNLESNWDLCVRLFGKEKTDCFKTSEYGMLRLALGIAIFQHMYCHRNDVFILDRATEKRTKLICNAVRKNGLSTGTHLFDSLNYWDEITKYDS